VPGFESTHEISILNTEWPIETTRELVEDFIRSGSRDESESTPLRQAHAAAYASRLTTCVRYLIGMNTLHTGFLASLRESLSDKPTLSQRRLAALSQNLSEADADTGLLRFSSDQGRMNATYARILTAISEAVVDRTDHWFELAIMVVEGAYDPSVTGPRGFKVDESTARSRAESSMLAIQNSQALRNLYNTKVAAYDALLKSTASADPR